MDTVNVVCVLGMWGALLVGLFAPDRARDGARAGARAVWFTVSGLVRVAWMVGRWQARRVRGAVRLRAALVVVDVRRRWGFLRAAWVLTRVCAPVAVCRYIPATLREEMRRFPGDVMDVIRFEWFLITGKMI